eukprot:gene1340-385_t
MGAFHSMNHVDHHIDAKLVTHHHWRKAIATVFDELQEQVNPAPHNHKEPCCCGTGDFADPEPAAPRGWQLIFHRFTTATSDSACTGDPAAMGDHRPTDLLDSSANYWELPGKGPQNGKYDTANEGTITLGFEHGRSSAYGVLMDWRTAPQMITSVKIRGYPDGPWDEVVKNQRLATQPVYSSSMIYFGGKKNVHEVAISMSGAAAGGNISIARASLVDNNPNAHFGLHHDAGASLNGTTATEVEAADNLHSTMPGTSVPVISGTPAVETSPGADLGVPGEVHAALEADVIKNPLIINAQAGTQA